VETFIEDMARTKNVGKSQVEEEFFKNVRPSSLLQRFETPAEIAAIAAFLCSPLAAATNGAAIRAEGGVLRSIL
jgi:NAD(P)-dependent dehydrogenase (short-subunit alcohol dehydrogenase family)